jgi:uracil-DNA glycosylase
MKNEQKFREFLNQSFGEHITNQLLDKNALALNKGEARVLYNGDMDINKNQVLNLVNKSFHDVINNNNWAFDFPGWIGSLDFTKDNVKDILVVGMEPHIGEGFRTVQVTYGLRETTENEFTELDEHLGNRRLWNNLNSVLNNNDDYYHKEKYSINQIDKDFFKQIYITDLSHFAIKGKAKEMLDLKIWPKIREENANKYISKTIELIRPKYVISQGKVVSKFVTKVLKNEGNRNENWNSSHYIDSKFPYLEYFNINENKIIHIVLPHLASGNTNNFWLPKNKEIRDPKMDKIRNELKEFEILIQKIK